MYSPRLSKKSELLVAKIGGVATPLLCAMNQKDLAENMVRPGKQPEIVQISFPKGETGIGLSIVLGQGLGELESGIYVKKIVPGSAAEKDGRLEAGDQLLKVNQRSLVGISQEDAALIMSQAGSVVSFEVAKQAALYNGLANSIFHSYPSPEISQFQDPRQTQWRHKSDQNIFHPPNHQPGFPHQLPNYGQPHPAAGHQRFASQTGYLPHPQHGRSASVSHLEHGRVNVPHQNYQNLKYQGRSQPIHDFAPPVVQHRPRLYGDGNAQSLMSHSAEFPGGLPYASQQQQLQQQQQQPHYSVEHIRSTRRPPSVDEAHLYRTHSELQSPSAFSATSYSPSVSGPTHFPYPTDYQNLPLMSNTNSNSQPPILTATSPSYVNKRVPQTVSISTPVYQHHSSMYRPGLVQPSTLPSPPPSSNEYTFSSHHHFPLPSAFPASASLAAQHQETYYERKNLEFQQNAGMGDEEQGHSSPPAPIRPPPALNKDEQDRMEKEIDDEVIRLMQEQADILERKEFLTEQEERRYRALKYELTYQQRLKQESSEEPSFFRRSTNDDRNLLTELGEFEPAVSKPEITSWNSPSNTTPYSHGINSNPQDPRGEYYARAEEKYREEALRQRQQTELNLLHQEGLSGTELDSGKLQKKEEKAVGEIVEMGKSEIHNLQTHMSIMSVEEQERLSLANSHCMNGNDGSNVGGSKKRGPEVPPKRRVAFQNSELGHPRPLSPSTSSISQENGHTTEDDNVNKKYVYIQSEKIPRAQILGAQEIYRDPRLERLHRIQQQQQTEKTTVDGSNLDFKTKMKMFAKQLGETTPNNRVKVSRAQRDIEEQMTPSPKPLT